MNCPGSVGLMASLPKVDKPDNPSALKGTAAHECGEMCLVEDTDAWEYTDLEFVPGFPVDDEMIAGVQVYVDYVRSRVAEHPDMEAHLEVKVELSHIDGGMFGTSDAILWSPKAKTLWVLDYKNGVGYVDVEDNAQLQYYALGALYHLGLFDAAEDVTVICGIVQPNCVGEEAVRTWATSKDKLVGPWQAKLSAAAKETRKENAKLCAGKWCKWCEAKGSCAVEARGRMSNAVAVFDSVPLTPELPPVQQLTPEQVVRFLDAEKTFMAFFKEVREMAVEQAKAGTEQYPGYDLAPGRASRKWKDVEAMKEQFAGDLGERMYQPQKLNTPAMMEKLVGKAALEPYIETTRAMLLKRVDKTRIENAVQAFLTTEIGEE